MTSVVPYIPEHLPKIHVRPEQANEFPEKVYSEATTFMNGDQPIAIMGYFQIAPGVMQVWALIGKECIETPISFHKETLKFIAWGFEHFSLRRMQMSVKKDFHQAARWAKALGFVDEGVMRKYHTDGSDCHLYARVS